jgi:hypothetical protein
MKNQFEIDDEIGALHDCKARLRHQRSVFGDDHVAAIDAQMRVLSERMSRQQVQLAFGQEAHESAVSGRDAAQHAYIYDQALEAYDWMVCLLDDERRPCAADGWPSLCTAVEMEAA